jgi:hypothetical protein
MYMKFLLLNLAIFPLVLFGCAHDADERFAENDVPYHSPLLSPGSKFGALPPAVQNTVRAETGAAEIRDIETRYEPGGPTYVIYFRNRDLFAPMFVAADGSLLHPDSTLAMGAPKDPFAVVSSGPVTGIKLNELPKPALKTITERAPGAQIASINKETWGDRNVFIVSFIDPEHHPRIYITADGKLLNEGPK